MLHLKRHPRRADGGEFARHQVELYDLRVDPACAVDRALEEVGRARELRRLLTGWLAEAGPGLGSSGSHDAETLEALAALGYSTEVSSADDPFWGEAERTCSCEWCERMR